MADNYTQFSAELTLLGKKEMAWWKRVLEFDWDNAAAIVQSDDCPLSVGVKRVITTLLEDERPEWPFECSQWQHSLVFHHGYDFSELLHLVQCFFKEMRPNGDDVFILHYACTCSKPRPDEFCGGTCVVTKHGIGYCGPEAQVEVAKANILKEE